MLGGNGTVHRLLVRNHANRVAAARLQATDAVLAIALAGSLLLLLWAAIVGDGLDVHTSKWIAIKRGHGAKNGVGKPLATRLKIRISKVGV